MLVIARRFLPKQSHSYLELNNGIASSLRSSQRQEKGVFVQALSNILANLSYLWSYINTLPLVKISSQYRKLFRFCQYEFLRYYHYVSILNSRIKTAQRKLL